MPPHFTNDHCWSRKGVKLEEQWKHCGWFWINLPKMPVKWFANY